MREKAASLAQPAGEFDSFYGDCNEEVGWKWEKSKKR
jgi:hypothetical protein